MIEFYLTVSLFCVGVHVVLNAPGMIGNGLANFLSTHFAQYLTMPLFECLSCMGSLYTIIFWFDYGYTFEPKLFTAMFIVCGLNTLFRVLIQPLYDLE